ncbi:hypothetical protein RFI_33413 [Reticulomyxa filosa]|uniref:Uncharacterized protein n=1 Tax=Reticulomyxa filosa TaxID=46433 RepID=X6LQU7_RETFI|nr:hypothetical protein RFI_33413 [Reticulomyxa filosa]|eukprot:ETO03989.1 hypothetical protein RFI_33413 [Reticulomyxa filosa]
MCIWDDFFFFAKTGVDTVGDWLQLLNDELGTNYTVKQVNTVFGINVTSNDTMQTFLTDVSQSVLNESLSDIVSVDLRLVNYTCTNHTTTINNQTMTNVTCANVSDIILTVSIRDVLVLTYDIVFLQNSTTIPWENVTLGQIQQVFLNYLFIIIAIGKETDRGVHNIFNE